MKIAIFVIQILMGIAVIGLILLQSSKGGLGGGIGSGEVYRSKRGAEKIVFRATIVFASIFLVTSIISVFMR
jgi:protein translocase SecG subunit